MTSNRPADNSSGTLSSLSVAAHHLKSPVAGALSMLDLLTGEYAGPLTDKQRELLARIDARCREAVESAQRVMDIERLRSEGLPGSGPTDLPEPVSELQSRFSDALAQHDVSLEVTRDTDNAPVPGPASLWKRVLAALIENSIAFAPAGGTIRISLEREGNEVRIAVEDSGPGIPPDARDEVFTCFHRTARPRKGDRPGAGLGLSLVKAVTEAAGGSVTIGESPLGGAAVRLAVPAAAQS